MTWIAIAFLDGDGERTWVTLRSVEHHTGAARAISRAVVDHTFGWAALERLLVELTTEAGRRISRAAWGA